MGEAKLAIQVKNRLSKIEKWGLPPFFDKIAVMLLAKRFFASLFTASRYFSRNPQNPFPEENAISFH